MQRMHDAILDGAGCRHQRLTEHLPAEDLRTADVAARPAVHVHLEAFEIEQDQQVSEGGVHGTSGNGGEARQSGKPWKPESMKRM